MKRLEFKEELDDDMLLKRLRKAKEELDSDDDGQFWMAV